LSYSRVNQKEIQGNFKEERYATEFVNFSSNDIDLVGQLVNIQINEALPNCLRGNLQN